MLIAMLGHQLFALLLFMGASAQVLNVPPDLIGETAFVPTSSQRQQFQDANPNANAYKAPFATFSQESPNGRLYPQVIGNTPILGTMHNQGMSQVAFALGPCAAIPAHVHPRAIEVSHVKSGSIVFGISLDDAGGQKEDTYTTGQSAIIPMGNIHFVENRSCQNSSFIATLSSGDPGTSFLSEMWSFSDQALRSTLGYGATPELITSMRNILADGRNRVPTADPACLQRCGIRQGPAQR